MKIGSIVECIDDSFDSETLRLLIKFPKKGTVYTVRDLVYLNNFPQYKTPGVLLEEIINPEINRTDFFGKQCRLEPQWKMTRFRELHPPIDLENLFNESTPKTNDVVQLSNLNR